MSNPAEKLSVSVTPAMAERMRAEVDAGRYGSVSEVVGDALRLWQKREDEMVALRARIQASLDDPRPPISVDEAFRRIREHAEAYKAKNSDKAA